MKRSLVFLSTFALLSCASPLTKEQSLVNRTVDAMGGADRLAAIKTVAAKGTSKQWEPEQSDMPGGEMRFANETSFDVLQDRSQRAGRTDIERRFVYQTPRAVQFSDIDLPDAGYALVHVFDVGAMY